MPYLIVKTLLNFIASNLTTIKRMTKKKHLESILEQQSGEYEYDMTLLLYIILNLPYPIIEHHN